jgi:hypothetical protein
MSTERLYLAQPEFEVRREREAGFAVYAKDGTRPVFGTAGHGTTQALCRAWILGFADGFNYAA